MRFSARLRSGESRPLVVVTDLTHGAPEPDAPGPNPHAPRAGMRLAGGSNAPDDGLYQLSTRLPISQKYLREATNHDDARHKPYLAFSPVGDAYSVTDGAVPTV